MRISIRALSDGPELFHFEEDPLNFVLDISIVGYRHVDWKPSWPRIPACAALHRTRRTRHISW